MSASPLPSFQSLPHVVWRRIVYYLSDSLSILLLLSSSSTEFQDICRPRISSHFHSITGPRAPLSSTYYYHSLVYLILQGHIDPDFIFEFYYHEQYRAEPLYRSSSAGRPGLPDDATEQQARRVDLLVANAIRRSPFVPADLVSEVFARFREGDDDAALVILLPLCTRLKLLEIPRKAPMCAAMIQSIAQEYQRRGISAQDARQQAFEASLRDRRGVPWRNSQPAALFGTLPLSELLVLYVHGNQHGCSFPLVEMVPFMGLPSLHRMVLSALRDQSFPGWPLGDVKSSCPQIYFQQSSVSKQAVLAFAQGLNAPCEIRQWYERPRPDVSHSDPGDPTWDRVLVERGADGSNRIKPRFDYAGGNPGYDHAWVSWLLYGKMQDWRRLDEEFAGQDDDTENEWLQGVLV